MTNTLEQESDRLRELTQLPASAANRAEAEAALDSKWEGIRSLAAQALGYWGGRESVAVLKRALLAAPAGGTLRRVIIREVARCHESEDIPWILDLYFEGPLTWIDRHYIRREMLSRLSGEVLRERLHREARSGDATHRRAAAYALVFSRTPVPGARRLLTRMLDDPSREVREAAQRLRHHPNAA